MTGESAEQAELEAVDRLLAQMARDIRQPLRLSDEVRGRLEGVYLGSRSLSAIERLDLYRQQFWLRHEDSLAADFPATRHLLGADWRDVCRSYLRAHPPSTPSLRELGFDLPHFLAELGTARVGTHIVDMARLEVAYLEVFDAPDEPALDAARVNSLGAREWPFARLQLSQALRVLEVGSPVADRRRALLADVSSDGACETEVGAPSCLAVYRRERALFDLEIPASARDLLAELGRGLPLAAACETVARQRPEAAELLDGHLGAWFSTWTRLGWIVDVVVPASP